MGRDIWVVIIILGNIGGVGSAAVADRDTASGDAGSGTLRKA